MTKVRKPIIAITAGYYTDTRTYACAIANAGGIPIVLLPGQVDIYLASFVDGIILAGGNDVHPHRYKKDFDPAIEPMVDEPRDHLEFAILQIALERGLPVLGVCRGLQLINVAYGGTLYQNLPGHAKFGKTIHFPQKSRDHLAHTVTPVRGRLQAILGSKCFHVNSIHRQGIATLGDGLHATVIAEDGLVEGLETDNGQVQAVQWHPEELAPTQAQSAALFTDLVWRASARMEKAERVEVWRCM